jgi:hypothetical protein
MPLAMEVLVALVLRQASPVLQSRGPEAVAVVRFLGLVVLAVRVAVVPVMLETTTQERQETLTPEAGVAAWAILQQLRLLGRAAQAWSLLSFQMLTQFPTLVVV